MDLRDASAADLGRAIGAGTLDPVDLTEHFLEAIAAEPLAGRIYARTTSDRARAEARAAAGRAKAGLRRGPLDGVPLSWKDLYDSAGVATEAGTALMAGRVPAADAAILRTATLGGAVCLGKTHLSEIAFSGLGYNPVTATAPNRHDPDAVPGGSSSGAAASVAFGLAPAAIGSDTGGSIRTPAAWADLVGVKPTHGALPMDGAVALCRSLDTAGPLCRSVEDGALILALLGMPAVDLRGASVEGLRLAVPEGLVMDDLDPAPAEAFESAVRRLSAAGAQIVRIDATRLLERAFALIGPVYAGEAWADWKVLVEAQGQTMFAEVRERVSAGAAVSADDFLSAWAELRRLRAEWAALTGGADAVICPSVAIRPPKVADIAVGGEPYRTANLKALRNTRMANFLGLPSISLPTGVPACGLLLSGHAGQDGRLLRLAAAAERALA